MSEDTTDDRAARVSASQRTPVSLLQELCVLNNMEPAEYQLMSVEGVVHAPTFMYKAQVKDFAATASGNSKKKAKHAAAKAVLEQLLTEQGGFKEGFVSDGVTVNSESLNDIIGESVIAPPVEDTSAKNSVGILQELCMKKKWQPPYYDLEKAVGLPHDKVFSMSCCILEDKKTYGKGKCKRVAKREAAENMLNELQEKEIISHEELEEIIKGTVKKENSNASGDGDQATSDKVDIDEEISNSTDTITKECETVAINTASDTQSAEEKGEN